MSDLILIQETERHCLFIPIVLSIDLFMVVSLEKNQLAAGRMPVDYFLMLFMRNQDMDAIVIFISNNKKNFYEISSCSSIFKTSKFRFP